jgi:translation initiation factor 2 subunit 2
VKKMDDYENLLNRAIDQLPPEVFETKRFEPVKAYSVIQGNRTFIQNFKDVADSLNRDPQHVLKYLLRELGTAGNLEGVRAILQGKFNHFLINERIDEYIEKYVICHECNRPDTKIIREDRIFILKCAACGAKAPLKPL